MWLRRVHYCFMGIRWASKRAKIAILYEIRFILGGYHVDIRCIVTALEQTIR